MERSDTCSWLFWSLCFLLSWCLQFTQLLEQFKLLLIVIACVWTPFPSGTVMAWRPEHHASVHPLNQTCLQFPTIWVPRHSPSVPKSPRAVASCLLGTSSHQKEWPPSHQWGYPTKYSVLFLPSEALLQHQAAQGPLFQCNHIGFISINTQFILRHTLHLSVGEGKGEWIMNFNDPITPAHLKAMVFLQLFIIPKLKIQLYVNI